MNFPANPFRLELLGEHDPTPESRLFDVRRPRGRTWPKALPALEPRCDRCGGPGPILQINNFDAGCLDCNLQAAVDRATAYVLMEV